MLLEGPIEYALARVQSQYGRRLTPGDWRRLETSQDLGQYLQGARRGIFADWVSALDRHRDVHAIERSLRSAWRRYVRAVAEWHPRPWQPWLGWLEWVPSLALLARLARPEPLPAWLAADPLLGSTARGSLSERLDALEAAGLGVFEPAIAGRRALGELWLAHWRRLQPSADLQTEQLLANISQTLESHAVSIAVDDADGAMLRERLAVRLTRLFRAGAGSVVATLCHLSLMALDFERLRGGLVTRALFAQGE
jgi:hypothetical protein